MKHTLKKLLGIIATMAGTESLLVWLAAIDRPVWFLVCMALYTVGLACFADTKETEINNI